MINHRIFTQRNNRNIFYTSYGRTALLLALRAIDVKGKDVIIPAFTCPVTVVGAVVQAGARPVFVEIDLHSMNFDPTDLASKVTSRTRAIISHHYFGMENQLVEQNHLFANKHQIAHIDDACHLFGLGALKASAQHFADMRIYSFSKNLLTPAGGILVCLNGDYQEIISDLYSSHVNQNLNKILNFLELKYYQYHIYHIRKLLEKIPSHSIDDSLLLRRKIIYAIFNLIKKFGAGNYYAGDFYNIGENNLKSSYPFFDVRMTPFQKKQIANVIKNYPKLHSKEKMFYDQLINCLPSRHQSNDERIDDKITIILWVKDKSAFLQQARSQKIHFHETWPAQGKCWKQQMTPNVRKIENHMVWLNISHYWTKKEVEILGNFIKINQNHFFSSIQEV